MTLCNLPPKGSFTLHRASAKSSGPVASTGRVGFTFHSLSTTPFPKRATHLEHPASAIAITRGSRDGISPRADCPPLCLTSDALCLSLSGSALLSPRRLGTHSRMRKSITSSRGMYSHDCVRLDAAGEVLLVSAGPTASPADVMAWSIVPCGAHPSCLRIAGASGAIGAAKLSQGLSFVVS